MTTRKKKNEKKKISRHRKGIMDETIRRRVRERGRERVKREIEGEREKKFLDAGLVHELGQLR